MKHFGDITKLSGYTLPIVDVITCGSPCQDLSVAGKRAGLAGERSGLFMEQIRIVKEMRERDRANGRTGWMVRPRYMVWENVPGAFSSGNPKGSDFAAVIEEIIKVAEPGASVSVCVPNGGWTKSGCYYAEDGSWSIAWRVHDAQFWGVPQRRKRISLVADFGGLSAPEILFEREGMSRDPEPSGEAGQETAGAAGESSYPSVARSLTRRYDGSPCIDRGPDVVVQEVEATLKKEGTTSLRAQGGDNGGGSENIAVQNAIVRRLTPLECERLQGYPDGWTDIGEWVDSKGKKHKEADSPRYKALGNSIALPFWQWMFGRIVRQYPQERRDKLTLGSLFDGIGGFPLTAQRNGIEPIWASEIEEFPIAVTKVRFPDESV